MYSNCLQELSKKDVCLVSFSNFFKLNVKQQLLLWSKFCSMKLRHRKASKLDRINEKSLYNNSGSFRYNSKTTAIIVIRSGRAIYLPCLWFLHNSKTPKDIEKNLFNFDSILLCVIIHILSIPIVMRCNPGNLLFSMCHTIFRMKI